MRKRGQITIFVIIAIIIVAVAVLIYMFFPQIKSTLGIKPKSPDAFLQNCLEDDLEEAVEMVSSQGGSLNPEHYILYKSEKLEYLCYTGEYYVTCVNQQPMLQAHIEKEITRGIKAKAKECLDGLERAYTGSLKRGEMVVELLPDKIRVNFKSSLVETGETSGVQENFVVILNNNLYELIAITNSILNWEARYGDTETTTYMNYYHDLKVEKLKQTDGSTIYVLTNRNTKDKFQFASRSVAWPPGFGV